MSIRIHIVKVTAAAALSAAALGIVSMAPAGAVAGDPSQWGLASTHVGSPDRQAIHQDHAVVPGAAEQRKVNEYEGQH